MTKFFSSFSSRCRNKINDVDNSQVSVKYVTVVIPGANVADIYTRENRKRCKKKKKIGAQEGASFPRPLRMKSHSCEEGRRWEGPLCIGFFCSQGANKGQTLNDDFKKPVPYQEHKSHSIIKLEAKN